MAVGRKAAAWDDAMQMRIMKQVLAPGVQHGEQADLGAQVLGIGGDDAQGLGGGAEEQAVDECLVLLGNGGNGLRQREDDVKVLRVEKLGATILQPLRAGQRLAAGQCLSRQLLGGCAGGRIDRMLRRVRRARRSGSIAVMTRRWAVDSDASCCAR